ncbi:glycosyltransferase family 4 protein [Sulfurovum sp.]|uniref:glycosyltransferase family 4 protein n=1 Tax=Sulfurovum sp. TaxID=1969726 RepID=UPI0028682B81|nr:glycosyltransferase family 4 protein [Sulfurovum sp.]
MKILFTIETLGKGGAERVLVNTLPELQKLGIGCEVAVLFERDDLADELEREGITVHRLNLSRKWNVAEGVLKLNRLVQNKHYDIIHAHLFFAYFYTGLIKLLHPKIKTVTTFHNLEYDAYPANTFVKKIRKKLDAFVVNKFIDKKVAVSNAVREHYAKHLKIPKVDLIFNSFPIQVIDNVLTADSSEILKEYVDVSLYEVFSITPGRLVKEKGHTYLLDAMESLNQKDMRLCHFIVGHGPLEEEIKSVIEEKKFSNVIFIPGLPQKELFDLIRACDLVAIPSISEGFGMVVGEAMALKKPIIATKIDGILDLVENKKEGLLVNPSDSDTLVQAMERMYRDKDLRITLAKNGAEKIKQFDTKIIAKQWKDYYEEMN